MDDDQLALFDLMLTPTITRAERERVKQASRSLLDSLKALLATMPAWFETTGTQAEGPPFTEDETDRLAAEVFDYVYARTKSGDGFESTI